MGAGTVLTTTTRLPATYLAQSAVSATSLAAPPLGGRRYRVSFTSEIAGMSFYINDELVEGDTYEEMAIVCRATYGVQAATLHSNGLDLVFIVGFSVVVTPVNTGTTTVEETSEGVSCLDRITALLLLDLTKGAVSKIQGDLTFGVQPPYIGDIVTVSLTTTGTLAVSVSGTHVQITQVVTSTAQEIADLVNNGASSGVLLSVDVTGVGSAVQTDFVLLELAESVAPAIVTEQDITFTVTPAFASAAVSITLNTTGVLAVSVIDDADILITQAAGTTAQQIVNAIEASVTASAIVSASVTGIPITHQTDYVIYLSSEASAGDTYSFKVWGMTNNRWYVKLMTDIAGNTLINTSMAFPFSANTVDRIYIQVLAFFGAGSVTPRIGLYDG